MPLAALKIAQDEREFWGGEWEGQGRLGDALVSVQVAELEGHRSRSAVCLVHQEGLGPALCGGRSDASAERLSMKIGCYHMPSVKVL